MNRTFVIFVLLALTLSACGSSPSLWGIPLTPTPDSTNPVAPLFDPFAVQDDPINISTSTPSPLVEAGAQPFVRIGPVAAGGTDL